MPRIEIIESGRVPISMPPSQFFGRTRAQNEGNLLRPQSAQPLTGWVAYTPGFHIRYRYGQAVAIKATLAAAMTGEEAVAWAGFQPAAAPACAGAVCRWEMGELCYDTLPLAATWNSATGELHVWQAQRGINGWLLAGSALALLALGLLLLRKIARNPGRPKES